MAKKNPVKAGGMFEGASGIVFQNAKKNRNQPTAAETVLWMHLREGIDNCKFRRQHPIGNYIADFYCHKAHLVIEVDGSIHTLQKIKERDEEKESYLAKHGYTILRFTNIEVSNSRNKVLFKIRTVLADAINKDASNLGNKSPL